MMNVLKFAHEENKNCIRHSISCLLMSEPGPLRRHNISIHYIDLLRSVWCDPLPGAERVKYMIYGEIRPSTLDINYQ